MKIRDTTKDGFISKEDFDLVVERYREMGAPETHLKKMVGYFDHTCKQFGLVEGVKLTYDQFGKKMAESGAKEQSRESRIGIFMEMFDIIDTNADSLISFEEWKNYYSAMGIDTKYARASFDAMNTKGDGIVSKEEFLAYVEEFYYSSEDKLKSSILYGPLE